MLTPARPHARLNQARSARLRHGPSHQTAWVCDAAGWRGLSIAAMRSRRRQHQHAFRGQQRSAQHCAVGVGHAHRARVRRIREQCDGTQVTLGASVSGAPRACNSRSTGPPSGSRSPRHRLPMPGTARARRTVRNTVTGGCARRGGPSDTTFRGTVTVPTRSPVTGAAGPLHAAGTAQPASNYFSIG